jgi:hypothetical protein
MELTRYLFNWEGLSYRQILLEPKRIRIDVFSTVPGA